MKFRIRFASYLHTRFLHGMLGLLLVSLTWVSCEDTKDSDNQTEDKGKNRQEVLTQLAEHIILPAYSYFQKDMDSLKVAVDAFAANPDESNLLLVRERWQVAYTNWQTVELFDFGPAETVTLRNFYNIYPADVTGIGANIQNPPANLEIPASYPQQGFPAMDYLLFGVGNSTSECLAFYTDVTNGAKRIAYLQRITNRMVDLLSYVVTTWNGNYKITFVTKTGLDVSSSTSLMVNALVMHYERYIRSGKVGIPSGVMIGGVVSPGKAEAYYRKGLSLLLLKTAHNGFVNFFNGRSRLTTGNVACLKSYLDALGAKDPQSGKRLSDIMNAQFDACTLKINALGPDISQEVVSNNEAVKAVFNEMQTAVRLLKVDMTSAMSITITYTDNDGD